MNEGIQKSEKNSPYSVVIGIDWADQKNDMCMIERESGAIRHLEVKQDAVALHEFTVEMRERYGREGKRIAMVVDQKRGGLINFLMGLEFVDIYPLHAARAKDYRRALYPSGAKSDPVDAQIHGEFYLKHPERFTQCLKPDTVETRELNLLCEHRRGFVDQGTQFEQQLSSSLKQYNPLIIKLFDDRHMDSTLNSALALSNDVTLTPARGRKVPGRIASMIAFPLVRPNMPVPPFPTPWLPATVSQLSIGTIKALRACAGTSTPF